MPGSSRMKLRCVGKWRRCEFLGVIAMFILLPCGVCITAFLIISGREISLIHPMCSFSVFF